MIKLENTIIQADMLDVLNVIKQELAIKDIDRFQLFKPNGANIQTNCPFHKGGKEQKPSFGVNIHNGKCHCFTCGWSGDISRLIEDLLGVKNGVSWLQKNFNSLAIETRPKIEIKGRKKATQQDKIIPETVLDSYRYIHPYMYKRGLTDEIIELFDVGYDKENDCITFPVKNLKGEVIMVATRSTRTKYFHIPKTTNKPVYCAELFRGGKYEKCYVTESFFNCLTLWKLGLPAVALMGTGSKYQIDILNKLPVREYILALDPDDAGQKRQNYIHSRLKNRHIVKKVVYSDRKKDINDLQEEFLQLPVHFY